ncbi:hypothetical protein CWC46_06535 [Prodigiosinella confusarubida]|uniref:Uncharacterized protein n=1 Tax=Serratia sp. (strain ATCC 39006) TaxID=104623 RepID=A0A2I5TQC0_SERS3|nr:hypothetical protein CWC46_06535 [Serratia sp. ATCC 39006]AUH06750.1 hypothetical protein Ser39006_006540 [Serratia sp. ATCC 39006]
MRLWVRAPRTSILSIHTLPAINAVSIFSGRKQANMKRLIMAQKKLNEYPVLDCNKCNKWKIFG